MAYRHRYEGHYGRLMKRQPGYYWWVAWCKPADVNMSLKNKCRAVTNPDAPVNILKFSNMKSDENNVTRMDGVQLQCCLRNACSSACSAVMRSWWKSASIFSNRSTAAALSARRSFKWTRMAMASLTNNYVMQ